MTVALELSSRVVRAADTVDQSTSDGHLVLDLSSGEYFQLGRVGGFIYEQLTTSTSLEALVDAILERFDVTRETAEADARSFVSALVDAGLATLES